MDRSINLSRYKERFAFRRVNGTCHSLAHLAIVSRSMFSNCTVTSRYSIIRYKLVTTVKSRIFACISFMVSFIKSKNNNGPNIEP